MASHAVVPISLPRCLFFTSDRNSNPWLLHHSSPTSLIRIPSKRCSSPSLFSYSRSSSPSVVEDDPADPAPLQSNEDKDLTFRGCKACGKESIEGGCDGDGRVQGGIATIPGFGWWPIKAYRPCPSFLASGGRYQRTGQSMDEVAFGRGQSKTSSSKTIKDDTQVSKKKPTPRKFKR